MRFTWDPAKSEANFVARGFDFAFATLIFQGMTLEWEDARTNYGELRMVAVGTVQRRTLTVVYTDRLVGNETERRIISARRSSRHEREAYQEAFPAG